MNKPSIRRKTATLPSKPVQRGTLPHQVYLQIKELILDGGIAPGELVTIQGLAKAFDVSAMPVREALQRLTAEKALTVVSGRSVGIPELDAERLRDLCRVRLEIESLATEWATVRIRDAELGTLATLIDSMDEAINANNTHAFVRANHDFHFTIYRASGSATLIAIIEELWLQVSPYFHLLHSSGNYSQANQQHRNILQALHQQDSTAAGASIRADISAAAEVLLSLLD